MSASYRQTSPTPTQIDKRVANIRRALVGSVVGTTVSSRQKASTQDPGVRGPVWVSRITYPAPPENDLQKVVLDAIKEFGDGTERYDIPNIGGLEAQWIGWRGGVEKKEPEAPGCELEKYENLMREVKNKDLTVFYVYGGAFMSGGPHSCRSICGTLAHLTGGRCYTVRYRLSPEHTFPAALLDVLHGYLTLISPALGSFHAPVAPSSIVFAGDSAGACLLLSLTQVLLSFARTHPVTPTPTILFHGRHMSLPLPAGLAMTSPGLDQTMGVPSWMSNASTDIFEDQLPAITDGQPPCAIWPSNPPRGHPYAESLTLLHPLASPCTTKRGYWKGAPPMWIAMGGGERLLDAAKVVARDAASDGCIVQWTEWERMPHQFVLMCRDWWQGEKAVTLWAENCIKLVGRGGKGLDHGGYRMRVDGMEMEINVEELTSLTRDDIMSGMRRTAEAMKVWTGERQGTSHMKAQL
ncbi:MAG: hypothetical protein M1827_004632 [Pycnora praestabilis]|nr:MAG: hypothetical protein M1827_004632 [Pycnora praestabilis]